MKTGKILKFYSSTCMPCKLLTKVLEKENIEHEAIDITDASQEVIKYNIRTVPTLVKVDGIGNELGKLIGFPGTDKIKEFCNN